MLLIPYDKVTFLSDLSADEIKLKLADVIDTNFKWYYIKSKKEFIGKIFSNGFKIRQNIKGYNTYSPFIICKYETDSNKTKVNLCFRLHYFAIVMVLAFFSLLEISIINDSGTFNYIVILVLLVFHCVMYFVGYLPGKNNVEKHFRKIFCDKSL